MDRLLDALPDECRLVLLGDADQLTPRGGVGELVRQGVERLPPEHRDELLAEYHERLALSRESLLGRLFPASNGLLSDEDAVSLDGQVGRLRQSQLLCVTRQGAAGLADVVSVAAGRSHACAALTHGRVLCWGSNDCQELGNGPLPFALTPVEVKGLDLSSARRPN
jgi:hypothetical protein